GLQQRSVGAAFDPAQDHVGVSLEPDRNGLAMDALAGLVAHHGAAARRDPAGTAIEQTRDPPRLAVPEIWLAIGLENVRDRHAVCGLDLGVRIDKAKLQP